MDRNTFEQQALQALNRGDQDAALRAYLNILKLDPKDTRIRQKVGDLLLRTGRTHEAERTYRDLYENLVQAGNHRAAAAIIKQLLQIRPEEARYHFDLGECYVASGYPNDARPCYESAIRLDLEVSHPIDAARSGRRLCEVFPHDIPARLKLAELQAKANDRHGALRSYNEVLEEFRRRGRMDEVGRIAELALRVKQDDPGLLLEAAAARVEAQDFKKALAHLQMAYPIVPKEPRTLDLLARAFEGLGQPDKAVKVLDELARAGQDRRDVSIEAEALRRLAKLRPDDEVVLGQLADAEERLSRRERRLTTLVLSQAIDEEELRAQVRAEVYSRFGHHDRAETVLNEALIGRGDSLPLLASLAEVYAGARRNEDAVRVVERLVPLAGAEVEVVLDRLAVLKGQEPQSRATASRPAAEAPSAATPVGPGHAEPSTHARASRPAAAPPSADSPTARGDRLAAEGDLAGAMMAWREALAADPLNEDVLARIASLRSAARSAPPPPAPESFEEIDPDAFVDDLEPEDEEHPAADALWGAAPAAVTVDDARALLAIGRHSQALDALAGLLTLEARVVEALVHRGAGDLSRAMDVLRDATNGAAEEDPAYPEALFELAGLYTETQKHRSAQRLLEELSDLFPDYRPVDVKARLRGVQLVTGGR